MEIFKENLKNTSVQSLYIMLKDIIDNEYEKYIYAIKDRNTYDAIVYRTLGFIKENFRHSNNSNFHNYFLNSLENAIDEYILRMMQSDENLAAEISLSYIEKSIIVANSYEESYKEVEKITSFFEEIAYRPSIDLCIKLLSSDKIFLNIKILVEQNMEIIKNGKLFLEYDDSLYLLFIEAYCTVNNIACNIDLLPQEDDEPYYSTGNTLHSYILEATKLALPPEKTMLLLYSYNSSRDEKIKNMIVEGNLKLVISIAKRYKTKELELLDLIQEGNIGLITAIDRFKPELGYQFSTYATWWIRQAIISAIANLGRNIRIPIYVQDDIRKYRRIELKLYNDLSRKPSIEEIAAEMKVDPEEVIKLSKLQNDTVSLNSNISNDSEDGELGDFIADETDIQGETMRKALIYSVRKMLKNAKLDDREKEIIVHLYGLGGVKKKTLEEVGNIYGISRERVRQIREQIFRKIIRNKNAKELAVFMDNPEAARQHIDDSFQPKMAKVKDLKSIYDYFPGYSREIVYCLIDYHATTTQKKLLAMCYPNSFSYPKTNMYWTVSDRQNFHNFIIKIQKILEFKSQTPKRDDDLCIEAKDYIRVLEILKTDLFLRLAEFISRQELILCILYFGYENSKSFSVNAISNFLVISENDIHNIIKAAGPLYIRIITGDGTHKVNKKIL